MRLFEIDDEFANREETPKQLRRVHIARIDELVKFFNLLIDKYKWKRGHLIINDYIKDTPAKLMTAQHWIDILTKNHPEISDFDLQKPYQKWDRMIRIKYRLGNRVVGRLGYL